MLEIVVKNGAEISSWDREILKGLQKELKTKRLDYRILESCRQAAPGGQPIVLIGSDYATLSREIETARQLGRHPVILGNQPYNAFGGNYSCVCSDTGSAMLCLMDYIRAHGGEKIALYGVNPASLADQERLACFETYCNKEDVYFNDQSLQACFQQFCSAADRYDAVICANDLAAVSLVRRLREHDQNDRRLIITSCSGSRLLSRFAPQVIPVSLHFGDFGRGAVFVCESIVKRPYISSLCVKIGCEIQADAWMGAPVFQPAPAPGRLSSDGEFQAMLRIETMLELCDQTDLQLLDGLLQGKSYQEISDSCFMAVNTIKYRVKKLMRACGVESKKDFVALLSPYMK